MRKESRLVRQAGQQDGAAIVWFRQDLRLDDNPALAAAVASGRPVLPLYILDDESPGAWRLGGASRWWLHGSLAALGADLARLGAPLVLRRGAAVQVLPALAADVGAGAVFWNRMYEPWAMARDGALKKQLRDSGLSVESFNGAYLHEPARLRTGAGGPFKVFTPFWKALRAAGCATQPIPAPQALAARDAPGDALEDWRLLPPRPDWAGGLREAWTPGEAGARARLEAFLDTGLAGYAEGRDRPDLPATSRLSPHLRWGEVSPGQIWRSVMARTAQTPSLTADGDKFLSEVGWREFSAHLLFHSPEMPEKNWRPAFDRFPWADAPEAINSWQRGQTGYPIVDAGMRELWATGFMHNRVRMIVASFLIKDLMVHWRAGEDWFWDTLVDADLANNAAGWQWVAGSGADASPYFRIFNPVAQGERHDPEGAYVRRWVPELAQLPTTFIHAPWTASEDVLAAAGVKLGGNYPAPIVDHASARSRALDAYKQVAGARDA
jgi:deoxyribodipyrimidine photo-lyase